MKFSNVFVIIASITSTTAYAKVQFINQIPNARLVPGVGAAGCDLCHQSPSGGDARNLFGRDTDRFQSGQSVNWTALCDVDSDGDGLTNGQELADPDCVWQPGDVNPLGEITNPADPNSPQCQR